MAIQRQHYHECCLARKKKADTEFIQKWVQNCPALLGSHCRRRTMDGSLLAPRMNSSRESFPGRETRLLSTCGGLQHTCQAFEQAWWKEMGRAPGKSLGKQSHKAKPCLPAPHWLWVVWLCLGSRGRSGGLEGSPRVGRTPQPSSTGAQASGGCLPSRLVSIWRKIFSVLFSGVDSSSGIFITDETIL